MNKILMLSLVTASTLFADSEIEALKKLVLDQQKTIQALQTRMNALEQTKPKTNTLAENSNAEETKQTTTLARTDTQKEKKSTKHAPVPKAPAAQDEYAQYRTSVSSTAASSDDSVMTESQSSSSSFDQSAFLPGIALIGNMSAVGRDVSNDLYSNYAIPGFIDNPGELPFNEKRGFNLNYGELEIFSTVGPYIDFFSAFHIAKDGLEIGELYATTRSMPYGLRLKGGKFKSEFGRINMKHQHAWEFTTVPLVFEAFFGQEGLNDEGLQLHWVAPTDFYLMAGVELMQGSNENSFGDTDGINEINAYLKSSFDISDMTTLLGGVTYMQGKNEFGDTKIYGADLTLRTDFNSYSSLTWQNELLYREKPLDGNVAAEQAGLYSQLLYSYNQNWSGAVRYDTLFKNVADEPEGLDKYSAMLMYRPFEFTKLRLQYSYDKSKFFDGEQRNVQEILLDLTFEAGAHGAHAF